MIYDYLPLCLSFYLFYAWLSLCSLKMQIWNYLNARLIFSGGYDKNKRPIVFYVLSSFRWIKDDLFLFLKVMLTMSEIPLMYCSTYPKPYKYLSAKTLVYKIYFWVSYFRSWFLWLETKKMVIPFLRIYLITSLLSMYCVSHIKDFTNLAGYPSLKPNIIFCVYLLDHNLSLSMDHQFKEDRKMMPRLKISSIFPKEKYFYYLPYLYHLFARGWANV
jgi:hypothetical protein